MKFSFRLIYFIIVLIIYSCNHSGRTVYRKIKLGDSTLIEKKTFDKNGSLIIDEILNKDSINNGYYREFDDGKIYKFGNYQNGKKNGTWFYLDFAGDTIKVENWLSGKRFGEQIQYYIPMVHDNRHNIYKYSFLNLDGVELFRMLNDTIGNIISLKGSPSIVHSIVKVLNKANLLF